MVVEFDTARLLLENIWYLFALLRTRLDPDGAI